MGARFLKGSAGQSLAFAQIVTVLMRSPRYRHYTLGELECLVIPPLLTGQYTVANTSLKQNGVTVPAIALWASVSADVDKKLSENLHLPIRLRPDEWRSGDVLWLIEAVGDPRAVPQLLKQLVETTFKGREVKIRVPGENGKVIVQRIAATVPTEGLTQKHWADCARCKAYCRWQRARSAFLNWSPQPDWEALGSGAAPCGCP
jgi:hemolysin-activating ACP:hemolysin acyltransferase